MRGLSTGMLIASGGGFDVDALAIIARMTTPPSAGRQVTINNLVVALKTAAIWTKFDVLYLLAAADSQAASLNWMNTNFTLGAGFTFTADRGYLDSLGNTKNTGYNPSGAGLNATSSSEHISWWIRSAADNSAPDMQVGAVYWNSNSGNIFNAGWSGGTTSTTSPATAGHYMATMTGTTGALYKSGSFLTSATYGGNTIRNGNRQLYGGGHQFAAASFGATLNGTEAAAFNTALQSYMTDVGA